MHAIKTTDSLRCTVHLFICYGSNRNVHSKSS